MSKDNDTKSKQLDNTINLYERMREKIGDYYYFWFGHLKEVLQEAEEGKKLVDRHRALFEAQRLVEDLRSAAYPMKRTFNKKDKMTEHDIKNISGHYGDDVAEYERARAGVWNDDDKQS